MAANSSWKEKVITDLTSLKEKRVIVRLDLNLPVEDGIVTDTTRMDAVLPFLQNLHEVGAKMVLMSHFGEKGESIAPIAKALTERLAFVTFNASLDFNALKQASDALPKGQALFLENVRLFPGETENLETLATSFASLGDVYINNAFSVSHRNHASVTGIPKHLLSFIGPTCANELSHLSPILTPKKPALLIIGGAKISTKLSLIKRYLDQDVEVFVGGAMVHNIYIARGLKVGKSLYDKEYTVPPEVVNHPKLLVPIDVVLTTGETVKATEVPDDGVIVDCGKDTLEMLKKPVSEAQTIIMNGPLGLYEKGWMHGTEYTLSLLGECPKENTFIGGGDTVAAAAKAHALDKIGFVSLGGGAMLDYLASGTLTGIDAVTESKILGYN